LTIPLCYGVVYKQVHQTFLVTGTVACPRVAIYKWSVFKSDIEDSKIVYIGETENLINRIKGYLRPGPTQQTNIRINKLFKEYLEKGYKISLHTLFFDKIKLGNIDIIYDEISDNDIRKALEQLFIVIYKKEEYTLLNR